MAGERDYLGRGVYTIPEAARLGEIPTSTLRNWVGGYSEGRGRKRHDAIWGTELRGPDGAALMSFLDLQEARIIQRLRRDRRHDRTLSLQTIRASVLEARRLFGVRHPFTRGLLSHDGHRIFARVAGRGRGESMMIDLLKQQRVFREIMDPFVVDIEVQDGLPVRWWPEKASLGELVVVDPRRSFGSPIVARVGIETRVLAACGRSNGVEATASWYEVEAADVRAAMRYEELRAPRAAA